MPPGPTLKNLGRNLRLLRTEAGLTQEQLAARVDMAVESISRLESGKLNISVENLERVATVLGAGLRAVFGETPAPSARGARPGERAVLGLLADLDDEQLRAVHVGLKSLLRVNAKRRPARKPTARRR